MSGFETRPRKEVEHLNQNRPGISPLVAAFAELPEDTALFVAKGTATSIETRRNSTTQRLKKLFPNRVISTVLDREKDGIWFWWEPKP